VTATGLKNAAASDSLIVVDAFDVGSRFEDSDPAIVYSGTWAQGDFTRAWSGTSADSGSGSAAVSATAGARATFTFTGTGVSWMGLRSPVAGIAEVALDGASLGRLDLYAATEAVQVPVWTVSGLAQGRHTLQISVTGEKNAAASDALVAVDGFDVVLPSSAPPVTRLQEQDAAITYTSPADWRLVGRYRYASGEFEISSTAVGATATLTFTGTAVRWIGTRTPTTGLARVRLDGTVVAQVDTRSPLQEQDQIALFSATGLTSGNHTVVIEVLGRNGEPPGATVEPIWIDAFDVY